MRHGTGRLWLLLASAVAVVGCTGSETNEPVPRAAGDAPKVSDGLTFTRSGGDTYELHEAVVTCQPSEADDTTTVVRLLSPAKVRQTGDKVRDPFLYVDVIPGTEGTFELPLDGGEEGRIPEVTVFGVDSVDQNELSGSVEVATGTLTIVEAACKPSPRASFTVRATLGSEFSNLPTVHVSGGLRAESGER